MTTKDSHRLSGGTGRRPRDVRRREANPWTLIDATLETLGDAQASLRDLHPRETTSGANLPMDESEGTPNA